MIPPLVERALALGLGRCSTELGQLLHALAAQRGRERAAVVGAAPAAWVASALRVEVPLAVVEPDPAAARLFAEDEAVTVLPPPWREALPRHAPFDLVVADEADEELVGLLAPGGTLVCGVRTGHPRLVEVELALSRAESTVLCVRVL